MEENVNNLNNPDISGLFSTYKTNATENEKNAPEQIIVNDPGNPVLQKIYQDKILYVPK